MSGEWLKDGEATQKTIPVDLVERSLADRQWIQVYADTEYFLKINLKSPGKNKKVRSKDMIPFAKYVCCVLNLSHSIDSRLHLLQSYFLL